MTIPILRILCGIPGSGKTTYANQNFSNDVILSSDGIREELYGDEAIQGNPGEIFALMQQRAVNALNNGENVCYDATNITRKDRSVIISTVPKFTRIECYIIWAPIDTCIKRDAARERSVGIEVIDKMLNKFQSPFYDEGINEIKIILPSGFNSHQYELDCWTSMTIPHDNPHHSADIDEHCKFAYQHVVNNIRPIDAELCFAALWHDIGKPYTKHFVNKQGEGTTIAHFFQHQCVGAWQVYGVENCTPYMSWLVNTHMDIFLNTKYYNNLPQFLKHKVDLLHEADLAAH